MYNVTVSRHKEHGAPATVFRLSKLSPVKDRKSDFSTSFVFMVIAKGSVPLIRVASRDSHVQKFGCKLEITTCSHQRSKNNKLPGPKKLFFRYNPKLDPRLSPIVGTELRFLPHMCFFPLRYSLNPEAQPSPPHHEVKLISTREVIHFL